MSPEWRLTRGFGTQRKCAFPLNRGVPSLEGIDTKIVWTFFRDQILCPLNGGDPWIEVSQRRGSTVGEIESLWSILNRPVGESECMTTFVRVVVIFRAKVSCITSMVKSSTGKSGWSSKTRCYWSPVGYAVVLLAMRSPNVMVSFRSVFCHNYNGRFFCWSNRRLHFVQSFYRCQFLRKTKFDYSSGTKLKVCTLRDCTVNW